MDKCSALKRDMVHYDEGDDSLTFINHTRDAEYTEDAGLVLLSINKRKQIVGMQLMGAHKNFKIDKKVLQNLTRAKVQFDYHKEQKTLIITVNLIYIIKKENP